MNGFSLHHESSNDKSVPESSSRSHGFMDPTNQIQQPPCRDLDPSTTTNYKNSYFSYAVFNSICNQAEPGSSESAFPVTNGVGESNPFKLVVTEKEGRGRKNLHSEDGHGLEGWRNNKRPVPSLEESEQSDLFNELMFPQGGSYDFVECPLFNAARNKASLKLDCNEKETGSNSKIMHMMKRGDSSERADLWSLLTQCSQAVASYDQRTAPELLKQIRQYSSPFGDGTERLAHYFANGLEARLAGTGTSFYSPAIVNRSTRQSFRHGGPPKIRITGIEFPQPGFRPAERIEETGHRLKRVAEACNVPFEYHAIAQKWETIQLEDLKIDRDEMTVVTCMYRLDNLPDDMVVLNSPRDALLNLIKRINPDMFVHGAINGIHNSPFFVSRFREALYHFYVLFDMFEVTVPSEDQGRLIFERELFGRHAMNVIACEGLERINSPETYKQWQARNLRNGFRQLQLDQEILKRAKEFVKNEYHKDFVVDKHCQWILQSWRGKIIYALSFWKPIYALSFWKPIQD
ncbi:hypothetical protein LWI28_012229 [Acer negundo]|uniref:Scarecrow-like protein 14 n=1 Tax=Acer negundo TaxID=4023 RepID=A0AAD5JKX5_ACENE|nr:hypothetical protein LWI28_012229 [Acer negundo]